MTKCTAKGYTRKINKKGEKMKKVATSFRLSKQTIKILNKIAETTGANKTAIVETAISLFAKKLKEQSGEY